MKKQGKKWMLVVLALLAVVTVTLPLVGCKNDTVAEQTGDGTGSGDGNQGSGDGNQGTGGETEAGGGTGTGDPEQPVTYTVSFNTYGGGSIDSQTIVSGQTATKPADPTLENNGFYIWYIDETLTSVYDFTTPVTSSFPLYAKWVEGTEVTVDNVSTVIEGLTGEEPHTLVVTGELKDLSAIKTALQVNSTAKVNLDLSKVSGLKTIGIDAFSGCSGLTSISIPSSVEIIDSLAFYGCSGLTSINIPEGVTNIGAGAFYGCSGLTSIDIPEGVTNIGAGAFGGCSSLNIRVNKNNTKYSSVDRMLLNKEKTTLIAYPSAKGTVANVPTSVTTIGDDAFMGCDSLTSIDLSKATGLTTIGNDAFYNCNSLTSISIPSSVTSIGNYAFEGCSELTTVTMKATTPPELGYGVFNGTADTLQILVPSGVVNNYKSAEGWSDYEGKIEAIPDQTS